MGPIPEEMKELLYSYASRLAELGAWKEKDGKNKVKQAIKGGPGPTTTLMHEMNRLLIKHTPPEDQWEYAALAKLTPEQRAAFFDLLISDPDRALALLQKLGKRFKATE